MAGIQLFNLGPPAVDTFSMIGNLGKSFFDAYDAQRKRRVEDEADKLNAEYGKALQSSLATPDPSNTPAAPSRSVSEVGKLPTFAQSNDLPYASAIKSIESSGNYAAVGPRHRTMGRALGAYQVMEANLPQWSREALGREVTPQEFLSNPGIQDQIFNHRFGQYVAKYGNPQDAASVWFSGRPLAGNTSKDVLGTSVPEYVRRFDAALAKGGGAPRTQVASVSPGAGFTPDAPPMPATSGPRLPSFAGLSIQPAIPSAMPPQQAPVPAMPAPAPQAAPVPAPASPPAPAPVQMAQAAPAAPVASDARTGDPIMDVLRRLPPQQQQWYVRALSNRITAPAAMQRLQSMVRQDTWSTTTAPNGQMIQTNQRGEVRAVPGFDKPQDNWSYRELPNGDLIGENAATKKREVIQAGERDAIIRQYEYAKRQGYQGSLFEFKTEMAKAARSETTINNNMPKADSKFDETVAADFAKEINETLKDGRNARGDLSRVRQLRAQIDKLPGGFAGGMQALANRYGIKLGPNPDAVEAATAIINQLVPQQRPAGSGTMSDRDVELFRASLPQLSNTPQGNKIILDTMEALANYRIRQGDIAARVMTKKITREQAIEELNNLPDPFESFNAATGQAPSLDKIKPGEVLEVAPGVTIRAK